MSGLRANICETSFLRPGAEPVASNLQKHRKFYMMDLRSEGGLAPTSHPTRRVSCIDPEPVERTGWTVCIHFVAELVSALTLDTALWSFLRIESFGIDT